MTTLCFVLTLLFWVWYVLPVSGISVPVQGSGCWLKPCEAGVVHIIDLQGEATYVTIVTNIGPAGCTLLLT